jgi:hypothetical protein
MTRPVILAVTVKNEAPSLWKFLMAIEKQTRRPDLFVVTVARECADKTGEILYNFSVRTSLPDFRVVWVSGNRSVGRNKAVHYALRRLCQGFGRLEFVKLSSAPPAILAFTNVSVPDEDWLEKLIQPFDNEGPCVVGGTYMVDAQTPKEKALALVTQLTPGRKLSALNMAMSSEVFLKLGGFPETLDTSEDTEIASRITKLARAGETALVINDATVRWRPATLTPQDAVETFHQYAVTDGQGGLATDQYVLTFLAYTAIITATAASAVLGILFLEALLLYRTRKVLAERGDAFLYWPLAMVTVIGIDVARMVGFLRGLLRRL